MTVGTYAIFTLCSVKMGLYRWHINHLFTLIKYRNIYWIYPTPLKNYAICSNILSGVALNLLGSDKNDREKLIFATILQ